MSAYPDTETFKVSIPRHYMPWIIGALLAGGVLLVAVSGPLGLAYVKECSPSGSCQWSPDDAERVAYTIRLWGGMAFAAGLVERLIFALGK